jgi:hypothetical protein
MSFSPREEYLKYLEQKHLALRNDLTKIAIIILSLPSSLLAILEKLSPPEFHSLELSTLFVSLFGFIAYFCFYLYLYNKVGASYYYELGALYVQRDKRELMKILRNGQYDQEQIKEKVESLAKTLLYAEAELKAVKLFLEKVGVIKKITGNTFEVQWS